MHHDNTSDDGPAPAPGDRLRFPRIPASRLPAFNLALAAVYALLALAGLELATVGKEVSPIWPAAGAAYSALFIFGPVLAPGVVLGAFVANLANGSTLAVALGIAVGNTLAPLAGAMLSRWFVARPRDLIQSVRGVWAMTLAGAYGGTLLSACGGVVTLLAAGILGGGDFVRAWLTWWLGDALGVLMVAPVLLAWWYREPSVRGWMRALELAVVAACIIGLATLTFGGVDIGLPGYYLQLYLIIPFMIWLGLRFPLATVAMVNLALAIVVTHLMIAGLGTHIAVGLKPRLEFVHGFLAITGFSALILSAAVAERRRAQKVMSESEARFKTLTALSSDWYWELDKELRLRRLAGRETSMSTVAGREQIGLLPWDMPYFERHGPFWTEMRLRLEARQPIHDVVALSIDAKGEKRYARLSGNPIFGEDGNFAGYRGVGKDVTAEVAAQDALKAREEQLRTLIEAMPDPVFMKDSEGRWIVANNAALRLAGLEGAAWPGRTESELAALSRLGGGMPTPCICGENERHAQDGICRREKCFSLDGEERCFDVIGKALHDGSGKPAGLVVLCRDITHLKRAEQLQQRQFDEIRRLNDELESRVRARTAALEASNRELEAFSYSVSHDLRSPLRALDGFSRMLEEDCEGKLDQEGLDHLRRIRRASQRMGELIDDLLDLSRITRSQPRRVSVDLSGRAEVFMRELREAEPERQVECVIAAGLSAQADAGLSRVMLENLLRNAWKFTRENPSARIEFGREEREEKRVFFVRDNGVGFDMGHAARLFSPFQRLHKSERFEGSGIGLAIVQRIVRLHGGEVWAESAPERGATFFFTFG